MFFVKPFSCDFQDKVLKEMDEQEEMKTFSSSEEESDGADEDIENERRLQKALFEKDKVWIVWVNYGLNLQVMENIVFYCN